LAGLQCNRLNFDNAQICWHTVASGNGNKITRDELDGRNSFPLAIAVDLTVLCLQIHQCFESAVSIAVLPHGHGGIDHQNANNHEWFHKDSKAIFAVVETRENERYDGGAEQDLDEEVLKLLHYFFP